MSNYEFFKRHYDLLQGIIYEDIVDTRDYLLLVSSLESGFFNVAFLKNTSISKESLADIDSHFLKIGKRYCCYLDVRAYDTELTEQLLKNKFRFMGNSCFVYKQMSEKYDTKSAQFNKVSSDNSQEAFSMLERVFGEGVQPYSALTIASMISSENKIGERESLLYEFRENNAVLSAGGLIFSKGLGIGYLHYAATETDAQGRGLQKDLIEQRINDCIDNGINYVYSWVNYGSISFSNFIKMGFTPVCNNYEYQLPIIK